MKTTDLFLRLAASHKPDCILSLEGPEPEAAPDPDHLARTFGSDAIGRYADECRPIYEDLRRVIGQLGGLLILARLTRRSEICDLNELTLCRARWQQSAIRLGTLSTPPGLENHKQQLEGAHAFSGSVLTALGQMRAGADNSPLLDEMSVRLRRAYAHLEAASSTKAGLQMVDFSHACCSCAH